MPSNLLQTPLSGAIKCPIMHNYTAYCFLATKTHSHQ